MPRGSKEKKGDTEWIPVSELSDDLLVEIISRVPYKSTRNCKCVCRRWRDLVSHPDHRKKLPRSTLAGFFYKLCISARHPHPDRSYKSVSGNWCPRIDPSLSFLPKCERPAAIDLLDCCNGLLLCRRWKRKGFVPENEILDYVVCNPATEQWVSVPATEWSSQDVLDPRLGFDPVVSSHFHGFEFAPVFVVDAEYMGGDRHIKSVGIYSSKARTWTHQSAWGSPIEIRRFSASAFSNGVMYFASYDGIVVAVVDVEGNFRVIPTPPHDDGGRSDLYLSREQLYLAHYGASELSIWALEDCNSENWSLKHKVSRLQLFGKEYSFLVQAYKVIIHPEENLIFILCFSYTIHHQSTTKLMSYEKDSGELRFICYLECGSVSPYLQYVPFFSESLADGH